MKGEVVHAQEKPARLAQILDRQPEDGQKHQHRVHDDLMMAVRTGIRRVEVERIVAERQSRKERIVALIQRAAPMMLEDLADAEIIEQIPLRQLSGLRAPVVTHLRYSLFSIALLLRPSRPVTIRLAALPADWSLRGPVGNVFGATPR